MNPDNGNGWKADQRLKKATNYNLASGPLVVLITLSSSNLVKSSQGSKDSYWWSNRGRKWRLTEGGAEDNTHWTLCSFDSAPADSDRQNFHPIIFHHHQTILNWELQWKQLTWSAWGAAVEPEVNGKSEAAYVPLKELKVCGRFSVFFLQNKNSWRDFTYMLRIHYHTYKPHTLAFSQNSRKQLL